jgi:hypothetical protein
VVAAVVAAAAVVALAVVVSRNNFFFSQLCISPLHSALCEPCSRSGWCIPLCSCATLSQPTMFSTPRSIL